MAKKIMMLGAGGHACVLVDILLQNGSAIDGIYSPIFDRSRRVLAGIPLFENENEILKFANDAVSLVNGVGSLPGSSLRLKIYNKFSDYGYEFQQVISQHSIVSPFATLGRGVQIMPGAIVQAGAIIGDYSIINSGAVIEHDCIIGMHNHVAPGATLSGQVTTGNFVHIGTGANVIQNISIGKESIVGVGANVAADVPPKNMAFGIKATIKRQG